jgi:hypothetical protein
VSEERPARTRSNVAVVRLIPVHIHERSHDCIGTPTAPFVKVCKRQVSIAAALLGALAMTFTACSNPAAASKPVVPQAGLTVRTLEFGTDAVLSTTSADGTCEVQVPIGYESCISAQSERWVAEFGAVCATDFISGGQTTFWLRAR